jgi:hypothetical protein
VLGDFAEQEFTNQLRDRDDAVAGEGADDRR